MTLEKNNRVDSIDFLNVGVVDINHQGIQKEVEMPPASRASVGVVTGSNTKHVVHRLFHLLKKFERVGLRNWWNRFSISAYFNDVGVVSYRVTEGR